MIRKKRATNICCVLNDDDDAFFSLSFHNGDCVDDYRYFGDGFFLSDDCANHCLRHRRFLFLIGDVFFYCVNGVPFHYHSLDLPM